MEAAKGEPDVVPPGQLLEPRYSGTAERLRQGQRLGRILANEVERLGQKDHVCSLLGGAFDQALSLCDVTLEWFTSKFFSFRTHLHKFS